MFPSIFVLTVVLQTEKPIKYPRKILIFTTLQRTRYIVLQTRYNSACYINKDLSKHIALEIN
jgi:hypothetical protein